MSVYLYTQTAAPADFDAVEAGSILLGNHTVPEHRRPK
jgi:hypothetical protein